MLKVEKVLENAKIPFKATMNSAGLDLFSCEKLVIKPHERALVSTGLIMVFPENTYGRIAERSGISLEHGIQIGGGVIDPDYRGIVSVIMINTSDKNFVVNIGDRIAQLICEKFVSPNIWECKIPNDTNRGNCGFGHTGIK